MITTSMKTPSSGAATKSTMNRASGAGMPHASGERSCQYRNAPSMPIAPWAKLKMPVVV